MIGSGRSHAMFDDATDDLVIKTCAEPLLQDIFGCKLRIANYCIAKRLTDYRVVILVLDTPIDHGGTREVVLKLAGPYAPRRGSFERTQRMHQLVLSETNLPLARIYAAEDHPSRWAWRFLVMEHLTGQPWAEVRGGLAWDAARVVYQQIGEAVAKLHLIRMPSFGEYLGEGDTQHYPFALREHARQILPSPRLYHFFLQALDRFSGLFEQVQNPSLCHEDLHAHNLLVQKQAERWQLSGILDFDKAWAGQAESDLARIDFWRGMRSPEFWIGYHRLRMEDPLYLEQRPIYQLLWCLEYAQNTPEHLADTQQVCRQLGLPLITSFD